MALPDFFKQRHAASSTLWARTGGKNLQMSQVSNNTGWVGARHDFGADFPKWVHVRTEYLFSSIPSGGPIHFHWLPSFDNTNYPDIGGSHTTTNSSVTATEYEALRHVIGEPDFVLPSYTSQNGVWRVNFIMPLPARYGKPLIMNFAGSTGNIANNNNGFKFWMTALDEQIVEAQ